MIADRPGRTAILEAMARSPADPKPKRSWSRRQWVAYWVFIATYLFAISVFLVAVETERRRLALGILLVGVGVLFALIAYAVRRVLRER